MKKKKNPPTVDVVIPAYNAAQFIEATLQSVLAQTLLPRKIIVVNDGSTDQTVDIVEGFQSERIELISVKNGGVSRARNLGIRAAQADYIAFLDADDLWDVDKLKAQLEALTTTPEAKAAYSYALVCDEQGERMRKPLYINLPYPPGQLVEKLLEFKNISGSASSVIVEAHFLKSNALFFDEGLSFGEDLDLWIRMAKKTDFTLVPWEHVLIRENTSSITRAQSWQSRQKWVSDYFYCLNKYAKDYQIPKSVIQLSLSNLLHIFLLRPYRIFEYPQFCAHLKSRASDYFNLVSGNGSATRLFMLSLFAFYQAKAFPLQRLQMLFSEGTIFFAKSKKYNPVVEFIMKKGW